MPPSRNAYSEVPLDSNWSEDAGSNFKQTGPKLGHRHTRLYILVTTICVICALLNALLLMLMKQMQPAVPSATSLARHDLWTLRRPSQYMYLDELERPVPPTPRHFDNFPLAVSHIDRSDAKRVIEHENKAHMGASGMYVPSERHVVITEHISTIVDFMAVDYGMEDCELHLEIDPDPIADVLSTPFTLEVFRLNTTIPVGVGTISYATRPPRLSKVAVIEVSGAAVQWHRHFHCSMNEVLSFEFACRPAVDGEECRAQWWQSPARHTPAIFVRQHATK